MIPMIIVTGFIARFFDLWLNLNGFCMVLTFIYKENYFRL